MSRSVQRQLFPSGPAAQHGLSLLLTQDGSTTLLCESIAGQQFNLAMWSQGMVERDTVPSLVLDHLKGAHLLKRTTSLLMADEVMMDNLSYTDLSLLPTQAREDLEAGRVPIGQILQTLWTKRFFFASTTFMHEVLEVLWQEVGMPDARASRAYVLGVPREIEGKLGSDWEPFMLIAETYRAGMWCLPENA